MTLLEAIQSGDQAAVAELLAADPGIAAARNADGVSYVSLAMYHRQPEIARLLAADRSDLDLYEACAVGAVERVRELIAKDPASVNTFSPDGFAPVALAAFFGWPDLVQLLAEAGADVNAQARNPMKVAALHAAVAARDARSVGILIQHGADPNLPQQRDVTPLQVATAHQDTAIIDLLRQHGAH